MKNFIKEHEPKLNFGKYYQLNMGTDSNELKWQDIDKILYAFLKY